MAKHSINEGWVTLRDPRMVSERRRRPILAKAASMQSKANMINDAAEGDVDEASLNALYEFNDLVAIALIESWSWETDVSAEALQDLASRDYDAIQSLVAPMVKDLMPSFEVTPEEDSPFVPSVE